MKMLEITSMIGCKNMCSYCPQESLLSSYTSPKTSMTIEDFRYFLTRIPKDVILLFAGFSEIFSNRDGSLMIREAITLGYKVILYTTLVGFTEKDAEILKYLEFDNVSFHIYESCNIREMAYKIELFKKNVKIKTIGSGKVDSPMSRGGLLWNSEPKTGKFYCEQALREFNHNVLLPNGDVVLCCMDFSLKHKLGNLYSSDYDFLNRNMVKELSLQENSEIICRKCELFVREN